jgi:uncharacterized protein (TIGR03067 family)
LIAATVGLATRVAADGLAAAPAGVAAVAYAQKLLKASGLLALGKAAAAVVVVGAGLVIGGLTFVGTGTEAPPRPDPTAHQPVAAAPHEQPAKLNPDAEWIQGRWVVVNAEQRGQKLVALIDTILDIDGLRFHLTPKEGDPERILPREATGGRFSLDLTADPRRLELIEPGRTVRGLYRLDEPNQRLLLCLDHPDDAGWPREVASNRNSGQLLLVFRRDGPPGRRIELPPPGR